MADYTRYRVEPEDVARRSRERNKKRPSQAPRLAVVKLLVVVLLLSLIAGLGGRRRRHLRALAQPAVARRPAAQPDGHQHHHLRPQRQDVIAELHGAENRVIVASDKIPDVMKQATVAMEDERFYEHHGVDFQGVVRAIVENLRAGGVVQGGSTITEQYVKNAYVGDERTYTRKIREAVLAWQLEDQWSKDQILTAYLNTIFYGADAYGVEAAAQTYFHKHASAAHPPRGRPARGPAQVPPRSSTRPPTQDGQAAPQPRAAGHGRPGLHHAGSAADRQKKQAARVYKHPPASNNPLADYFIDYVTRVLTKRYGSRQVFEGGLRVYTSIDIGWQREAIDIIKAPPGRWTSASSPPRPSSPSTPGTATSAPWSAASTTRSRSSTSPGRRGARRAPR